MTPTSLIETDRAIRLHAKHLCRSFQHTKGQLRIVDDVSLTLHTGEVLAIVGPSGCGKTTLLKMLAGLLAPTSGSVVCPSQQLGSPEVIEMTRAFVFQKPLLFAWRTVAENVLLPLELHLSLNPTETQRRCDESLDAVGLTGFDKFYPNQLSGGMAQRACLARALISRPQVLFLDEPLSAVDEFTRERLWVDFRELWVRHRLTVVLVTHNIAEAVFLADRVAIMSPRPGRFVSEISVPLPQLRDSECIYQPEFVETCRAAHKALFAINNAYES